MAGGQAWQLSLPCCPARCSGRALQSSDPPGSFPGALSGSGLLSQLLPLSPSTCPASLAQVWSLLGHDHSSSHHDISKDRLLGQLLGHLIVCWTSKIWEIQYEALDTLHYLCRCIQQQKCVTSPEDDLKHPQCGGERKAGRPSWLSLCSARSIVKAFGEYLHPADKTVIVLRAIEAMRDSCTCDKEELISIVDVAMTEPASWLTEVWIITRCIYKNLQHISTASARCSLKLLFLSMAEQNPREMILSLIDISPASASGTQELHSAGSPAGSAGPSLPSLFQLLASSDVTPEAFAGVYNREKFPWCQNVVLFSLTLTGLITLSQSPDKAKKILVLLPDLICMLQTAHSKNRKKMLLIFRNVMGHLKKKDSSTALQLAENLPQLFDDVSSQVRELSICLFKEVIQMADWKHQRQMRKNVQGSLVPLVLHMSDETESVAKASHEAFCVAAKVLKWKWLSHHVQALERWRTVECLLEQEQSRAEKYVRQSLLYLQHAQVSVRLAAVRFIGMAARCLKDSRADTLLEVCEGKQGQCCVCWGWWGRGQSLGSVLPCPVLLQGTSRGHLLHS
ncbi:uncharacterized protein LOC134155544 [Pezoporus occidentalis]|uniref:uncharacterized protein LOC134155544 n=1 Tax=Pezoporus occidentalis TaxID=407982 RepID=UPI002F91AF07